MDIFCKIVSAAYQDAGYGDIDQKALCTFSAVFQHAFVATLKPPALSLYIIQRSHMNLLIRARIGLHAFSIAFQQGL
jgi:hypothetical protein